MELVRVNTTLSKQILGMVDHYAQEMQEDRSTAIRQLLARALFEERKNSVLKAYKDRKLTVREAANVLGIDYWQMQSLFEENGIPITDLAQSEVIERKEKIKKLQ